MSSIDKDIAVNGHFSVLGDSHKWRRGMPKIRQYPRPSLNVLSIPPPQYADVVPHQVLMTRTLQAGVIRVVQGNSCAAASRECHSDFGFRRGFTLGVRV